MCNYWESCMYILLVEDNDIVGDGIKQGLETLGHSTDWVKDAHTANQAIQHVNYDVVILDLTLPDYDGMTLLTNWRQNKILIPVLILTARDAIPDRVTGLSAGADDYLTKPFDSEILLAKIKSLFSRKSLLKSNDSNVYEFNFSEFNFNSKLRLLNQKNNDPIKLSPKENELLKMLVLNINDLLPRDIALNKIWRDDNYFTSRSMDVYIAKLRKYLESDKKIKIINIHGEGFRLTVDK